MQRPVLLATLALLAPLAAHADVVSPTPSPRLPPPPMPKVTSIDDIAGDWMVTTTIRFSSCTTPVPGPSSRREEVWSADHQAGTLTIRSDAGQEYEGPAAAMKFSSFKHQLGGKPRPNEEVLQLHHYTKDRFFGTILRAQPLVRKGVREVCVSQIDFNGKRAPAP